MTPQAPEQRDTRKIVAEIYHNLAVARMNFAETREILRRIPTQQAGTK